MMYISAMQSNADTARPRQGAETTTGPPMKKIGYRQALTIVCLQDAHNRRANDNWISSGYPQLRGMLVEAVEALDHHGWKWWSSQPCDFSQMQVELVDILHFLLSHVIGECNGNLEAAAAVLVEYSNPGLSSCIFDRREYVLGRCDIPQLLELIAAFAICRRINLPLLEVTFHACCLDWDAVVSLYTSKHVLAIFRQNHGYKEGFYTKIWAGKEDNIHLLELASELDPAAPDFQLLLYRKLEKRYASPLLATDGAEP